MTDETGEDAGTSVSSSDDSEDGGSGNGEDTADGTGEASIERTATIALATAENSISICSISVSQLSAGSGDSQDEDEEEEGDDGDEEEEEEEEEKEEGDEGYAILAQASADGETFSDADVYDSCPVILSTNGKVTVSQVISEYNSPEVIGYLPYEAGTTYAVTISPLDASADWISAYFFACDSWDSSNLKFNDEEDGITFTASTSYSDGTTSYPCVEIKCIDAFPSNDDFYYVAFRTANDDDQTVAILFLYPTTTSGDAGSDEPAFFAVNGTEFTGYTVTDEYTGYYSSEIAETIGTYSNVVLTGYIAYAVDTPYLVGITTATSSDEWACEPKYALDLGGNELSGQTDVYEYSGGNYYTINGASRPCTELDLLSDPGTPFYFVWTDDDSNNYILFFTTETPPASEGDDDDYDESDFVLVYTITEDGTQIKIPLGGTISIDIDWGDGSTSGTITSSNSSDLRHTYSSAGSYTVKISGSATQINSNGVTGGEYVTAIKNWGALGLTSLTYAFYGWKNLTSLPEETPASAFENVTDIASIFRECSSLKTIPADIFDACTSTSITSLNYVFADCTSLTEIPEGLFDNFSSVTAAQSMFNGCTSLTTIPVDLFDNCKAVKSFSSAFKNCSEWTGESPYTEVGGTKVHIYERNDHTDDGFATVTVNANVFYNCTKLTDYDEIPDTWKQGQ